MDWLRPCISPDAGGTRFSGPSRVIPALLNRVRLNRIYL